MEGLTGMRVLVVDDDVMIGMMNQEMLEDLGCRTVLVDDAASALERLATEAFDLLLSDIRMPGMNGVQLARQAQGADSALTVVLCSGDASAWSDDLRGAPWAVLDKPFTQAQLAAAMVGALTARAMRPNAASAPPVVLAA